MERKIAGVIGAIATLGAINGADAATPPVNPAEVLKAGSFADLLKPIPNALAALRAVDEAAPIRPSENDVQTAQYYPYYYHHHHHHHHHSQMLQVVPGVGVVVVPQRRRRYYDDRYYHHHHHHHHSFYRRDY